MSGSSGPTFRTEVYRRQKKVMNYLFICLLLSFFLPSFLSFFNLLVHSFIWLFVLSFIHSIFFRWSGFSPKRVFTEAGFHRMPLGVGFHRMPFGGGDSPNIRVDFPTVFGRFGESPPPVGFHRMPL